MSQSSSSSRSTGATPDTGARPSAPGAGASTTPRNGSPAATHGSAAERSPTEPPTGARPSGARSTGERSTGERSTGERVRHAIGEIGALPRLASRATGHGDESAAERIARRRQVAQAELDAEALGEMDWGRIGVFGAGIAIGALIGAGAALLLAPATGFETRTRLVRRARDAGDRAVDRWDDVSDDVRRKARRGARKVQRAATTSRWKVEDAWEQRRRSAP